MRLAWGLQALRSGWHYQSVQAPHTGCEACAYRPGNTTFYVTTGKSWRRRLLGCDVYSFEFNINHIARHIRLPDPPVLGPAALARPLERRLPPLLVVNVQLPMYPVGPPCIPSCATARPISEHVQDGVIRVVPPTPTDMA